MMHIIADLHTHTNVSAHAHSSLEEMVQGAKRAGLSAIAITNHGPAMEDGAHQWHYANLNIVPRKIDGITVFRGAELNVLPPGRGRGRHRTQVYEEPRLCDCLLPSALLSAGYAGGAYHGA